MFCPVRPINGADLVYRRFKDTDVNILFGLENIPEEGEWSVDR